VSGAGLQLVANARMYSVAPGAVAAWNELFAWLSRQSGVALSIVNHPPPAPLGELWSRPDLGCAFMCGLPFASGRWSVQPIAAPVPADPHAEGRPVYWTDFVVAANSPFERLEDTFGNRIGWTVEDSQSGFNAPRHHLLVYRSPERPALYAEAVGPLVTPRAALAALLEGRVDVAPLDSLVHALLRRHDPALAARLRVIARTEPTPAPLFVAGPNAPPDDVARLTSLLEAAWGDSIARDIMVELQIIRFTRVESAAYTVLTRWEAEAEAAGYPRIA
jgi:ABC-type phosphate/phosphonate transport system substrate-binding protein